MLSTNPRADLFRSVIPDYFFDAAITNKYDQYLKQHPYIMTDIQSVVNESIQGYSTPSFGWTPTEQQKRNSDNSFTSQVAPAKTSTQNTTDKTFALTFRHIAGYLNYYCMLEHYFSLFRLGPERKRPTFGTIIVQTLNSYGDVMSSIKYNDCVFTGIDPLQLSYSNINRDFLSFDCSFAYSTLETTFSIPELKAD